jgi:hypothetical protein
MGHPELEEETVIKKNGLSLGISIFFLGGTMAGTGVLALARAMVDTGIQPSPSSTWVGPWLALESWL